MKSAAFQKAENKNQSMITSLFNKNEDVSLAESHDDFEMSVGPAFSFGNIKTHNSESSVRVQPKLQINQPGDKYEQEADAVADKVMGMQDAGSTTILFTTHNPATQAISTLHKRVTVQRKQSANILTPGISPAVEQTLQSTGQPLEKSTRSFMEQRFCHDFSKVQIHNDSLANRSSKDISAHAYTHGNHIVFGSGEYQPASEKGRSLLAHELTHVVQNTIAPLGQTLHSNSTEMLEHEAQSVSENFIKDKPISPIRHAAGKKSIQRKESDSDIPPPVIASDDPRTIGILYSPKLVQEYKSQQTLYVFSQTALDRLEVKELNTELSDDEKHAKETLTAQVAKAQRQMLQARKDYEMLNRPASTHQQLQEMIARRRIRISVNRQTEQNGAPNLDGSQLSSWGLDDKGFSKKSGTAASHTVPGLDDTPVTFTNEKSSATNIGLGTFSKTKSDKDTAVAGDKMIFTDDQRGYTADVIKGQGSYSKGTVTGMQDDPGGKLTSITDKTTYAAGLSGIIKTKDDSTQVGSKLDSKSSSRGLTGTPGQLGFAAGSTTKSGIMEGEPGQEKMVSGTEKSNKITGGLVSDDKGTGIGGTASQDRKRMFDGGKLATSTLSAGGRCQALVKEVEGSGPPKFTITTTISFDLKLGIAVGKEAQAKPGAQHDTGLKANVGIGASVSVGTYASFKRQLNEADAIEYIKFIRENGHGSKLPEHMILATGDTQGWGDAKKLWQVYNGSPELLKTAKPGDEFESNMEVGRELKYSVGGGESREGGFSAGLERSDKKKRGFNLNSVVMPDGKVQITATIDYEDENGIALTTGMGAAGGKGGKTSTNGEGRKVVFLLDPKDVAFDSQLKAIDKAITPNELNNLAARNHIKMISNTDKKLEGEGSTAGLNVGPIAIDLTGKGKLKSEVTHDQHGNITASKFTGDNQGGGTLGVGELKVGDTKTETYVGEVDKEGRAKGELSEAKKSTSFRKTVLNAGGKLTSDPLGTLMNPGKVIEDATDQKGTDIGDPEIMSICYSALNKSKWDWKVGGQRHDDWVKTGAKIRNACSLKGVGADAEIVNVNKHAVQQALAEWIKADVEGRKQVLDALIRPLGGIPSGKNFAFPDGTESMKADWDALIATDPLEDARKKLANNNSQQALAEMQMVKNKISSLYSGIKSASKKWEGFEIQQAEMLGHINTRLSEVNSEINKLSKKIPSSQKAGESPAITTVATVEQAKEQEGRDRANEARSDLEVYNSNIEIMQNYANSVFRNLGYGGKKDPEGKAEEEINSFFGDKPKARQLIKETEDLIKIWDSLYWTTYKIYEKWSPYLALNKSRLENLHTASARDRWQDVYNLTRDKSMSGR